MSKNSASAISKYLTKISVSIDNHIELIRASEGDINLLVRSGQPGFYAVADGHHTVEVVKDKRFSIIRVCGPGDIVGFGNWFAPFSSEKYQVRSLEDGTLHFMAKSIFEKLSVAHPGINSLIIESLCKVISLKDERISSLENLTVKARVSSMLLSLSKKFGTASPEGVLIDVKIGRKTLAMLAGTSVESLARNLTELEDGRLIIRNKRKIVITDAVGLAKVY